MGWPLLRARTLTYLLPFGHRQAKRPQGCICCCRVNRVCRLRHLHFRIPPHQRRLLREPNPSDLEKGRKSQTSRESQGPPRPPYLQRHGAPHGVMEGQLSGWVWVGWWGKSGKLGKHVKIGMASCRAHTTHKVDSRGDTEELRVLQPHALVSVFLRSFDKVEDHMLQTEQKTRRAKWITHSVVAVTLSCRTRPGHEMLHELEVFGHADGKGSQYPMIEGAPHTLDTTVWCRMSDNQHARVTFQLTLGYRNSNAHHQNPSPTPSCSSPKDNSNSHTPTERKGKQSRSIIGLCQQLP